MRSHSMSYSQKLETLFLKNFLEYGSLINYAEHMLTLSLRITHFLELTSSQVLLLDDEAAEKLSLDLAEIFKMVQNTRISLLGIENALFHVQGKSSSNVTKSVPKTG